MMRLIAIVISLTLFTAPCIAVPDSVTTGPYKISFDLGIPKEAYYVTVSDPKEKESLGGDKSITYSIFIKNVTGISRIALIALTITKPELKTFLTPEEMQMSMRSYLPKSGLTNIETSAREIDGKTGAIASGDMDISGLEIKLYQASYYPSKDTMAFVQSSYPWDEETLSLLKSIHIETINATA
jgi:hypothetical protein